jgi:hypothetical protein
VGIDDFDSSGAEYGGGASLGSSQVLTGGFFVVSKKKFLKKN